MSEIAIQYGVCWEDKPKVLMSRVVGLAATAITQATLAGMSYLVKRYASREDAETDTDGTSVIVETTLTPVSSYVFDTPQTDNDWGDTDSVGYNVKLTVPAAAFPTAAQHYRIEVWGDPASGDDFLLVLAILFCKATMRG